jgi:DNA-binding transcriptional regulator YhcF (GntR family)
MYITKEGDFMYIHIDFNSEEAIYVQLQNQIIMGIAMNILHEGDSLPSVRHLAETAGINMHTVNKAYTILKQDGYIQVDKRRGAVIAIDINKAQDLYYMKERMRILLAKGRCKNISREEVHALVDEIFEEYGKE